MLKFVATLLAIDLLFIYPKGGLFYPYTVGINGTFFSTKPPYHLATLVYFNGKMYGEFPTMETKQRGGLICMKDGTVHVVYFFVENNILYFTPDVARTKKFPFREFAQVGMIKWAISGGGVYIINEAPLSATTVKKREKLPDYIIHHKSYSFILVHQDQKTITLAVSKNYKPPYVVARQLTPQYIGMLRLDGGSQTRWWKGKTPRKIHNGLGLKIPKDG